jgi:beta-glucanase (GH16 family)
MPTLISSIGLAKTLPSGAAVVRLHGAGNLGCWLLLLSALLMVSHAYAIPAWRLVFFDEFSAGTAPDSAKWGYDIGGGGWGNQELQAYTSRQSNVRIENGHLVIEAHRETVVSGGTTYNYTSGRIKTQDKFARTYGRFEARAKLPSGQGFWPAFWMLGANIGGVGWPNCGEIDIFENIGREPATVHASVHGPGYSATDSITSAFNLPFGQRFSDAFHVFAIEWTTNRIRFLVDEFPYFTVTPSSLPPQRSWVFDHSFFIILNVAVGGVWPGSPNASTPFPQQMLVDYVRVYAAFDAPAPALQPQFVGDQHYLTWSADFPQAVLQQTESLPATSNQWTNWPAAPTRSGVLFWAPVSSGFYRLELSP